MDTHNDVDNGDRSLSVESVFRVMLTLSHVGMVMVTAWTSYPLD